MGPDEFVLEMHRITDVKVPELIRQAEKKIAFEALRRIILKSPVDTGLFRANWQVGIEIPNRDIAESVTNNAQARAGAVLESLKPFDVIWICNNLAYAEKLEHGHSKQAPQGMVAITVQEIEEWFKSQKFEL